MRKSFGAVSVVCFSVALALGCSSSNSGDDDLGPNPNAPVMDALQAPDTVTKTVTATGSGWVIPLTVSFHDDHENVNRLTFSAQGAETNTLVLETPTNKQVNEQYSLILYASSYDAGEGGTGVGVGFRAGTYPYSIAAVGVSGVSSASIQKTITLQ